MTCCCGLSATWRDVGDAQSVGEGFVLGSLCQPSCVVIVSGPVIEGDAMRETTGNLWDHYGEKGAVICITTNGFVKKSGECVMGRGCAFEAAQRFPDLPKRIGDHIKAHGNTPRLWLFPTTLGLAVCSFPVKHNWWEAADLDLIEQSARALRKIALTNPRATFYLPRPGCGNGKLEWEDVKPVIAPILPNNIVVITFAKENADAPISSSSSGKRARSG